MSIQKIGFMTYLMLIFLFINSVALAAKSITFEQALNEGRIQVEITSLGGSTGDAILINITRKVPEKLRISLSPGTVLKSTTGNVQNMIISKVKGERIGHNSYRPTPEIYLNTDKKQSYIVEAYCLDFNKPNPGLGDNFTISQAEDRTRRIIIEGEKEKYSTRIIQSAIWIDRAKVTSSRLKNRFPVNDNDIEIARRLLVKINKIESSKQILKKPDNSQKEQKIFGNQKFSQQFMNQPTIKPIKAPNSKKVKHKITIKGKIINLEQIKKDISAKTYLQLVFLPEDGRINFTLDEKGRMALISSLPIISFPLDGTFIFETDELKPGKYLISNQFPNISNAISLLVKKISPSPELVILEVPDNKDFPIIFEIGSVYIKSG